MTDAAAHNTVELPLLAGTHPNGQPVIERVRALRLGELEFRLLHSPLLVSGTAGGDEIRMSRRRPGTFQVLQRSGQLALRVLAKMDLTELEQRLTPEVELLGGSLDLQTPRGLVYSLHVAIGFRAIEALFERELAGTEAIWQYGNVYDEQGEPQGWWEALLNP